MAARSLQAHYVSYLVQADARWCNARLHPRQVQEYAVHQTRSCGRASQQMLSLGMQQ